MIVETFDLALIITFIAFSIDFVLTLA